MSEESSAEVIKKLADKDKKKSEPLLACTVLISGTRIGPAFKAKNAVVRLPKSQAEALASLTPPRVRIDGV